MLLFAYSSIWIFKNWCIILSTDNVAYEIGENLPVALYYEEGDDDYYKEPDKDWEKTQKNIIKKTQTLIQDKNSGVRNPIVIIAR